MGSTPSLISQGMALRTPGLIFFSYKLERLCIQVKNDLSPNILSFPKPVPPFGEEISSLLVLI